MCIYTYVNMCISVNTYTRVSNVALFCIVLQCNVVCCSMKPYPPILLQHRNHRIKHSRLLHLPFLWMCGSLLTCCWLVLRKFRERGRRSMSFLQFCVLKFCVSGLHVSSVRLLVMCGRPLLHRCRSLLQLEMSFL